MSSRNTRSNIKSSNDAEQSESGSVYEDDLGECCSNQADRKFKKNRKRKSTPAVPDKPLKKSAGGARKEAIIKPRLVEKSSRKFPAEPPYSDHLLPLLAEMNRDVESESYAAVSVNDCVSGSAVNVNGCGGGSAIDVNECGGGSVGINRNVEVTKTPRKNH